MRLYVNNTLVGLYAVVESIDKRFLERVFSQDNGNLFEFNYTFDFNFEYLGDDLGRYQEIFDPKTNESHSTFELFDPIHRMVRMANEASDATFAERDGRIPRPEGVCAPRRRRELRGRERRLDSATPA